ncbi:MAG: DUF58 domain-containing protein [Chloroflexi bacterium]|nr:DUF58 domain-containing protein [Chloroflexota bacterium]
MRFAFWKAPASDPIPVVAPSRATVPPDVLRKVRRIEIRVRRLVNTVFLGEYHSVFRGQGIEFSEVREYAAGDDARLIDWNVTARMGYPYIKKYVEERELNVVLAVDISGSNAFGSERPKLEVAAEVCALLAFSAIRNNDKVGLLTFSDIIERFVPPRTGREHALRVVRELLLAAPQGRGTDIGAALGYLGHLLKRRSLILLVSDFLASGYETALRVLARRHDIVALTITDPRELTMPAVGLVELEDGETGQRVVLDTASPAVQAAYARRVREALDARDRLFQSTQVDRVDIRTNQSYVEPLIAFFEARARRRA